MFQPFLIKPGTQVQHVVSLIRKLKSENDLDKAEILARQAVKAFPNSSYAFCEFASVLAARGSTEQAEYALKQGINNYPNDARLYFELINLQFRQKKLNELAVTYQNLVSAWKRGLHKYDRPNSVAAMSLIAIQSLYRSDKSDAERHQAHEFVGNTIQSINNNKKIFHSKGRNEKLRIGFVSTQLIEHAVSNFTLPFLRALSGDKDYYVFYDMDEGNERGYGKTVEALAGGLSPIEVVKIHSSSKRESYDVIRDAKIDLLIDLAGHFSGAPLNLFAMKAAPVQASWIGYPAHTGLSRIDYFLSDGYCSPVHKPEVLKKTSKIYRFNRFFSVYEDPILRFARTKRTESDRVRFGSFNNINKLSDATLEAWAQILEQATNSDLYLKFGSGFTYQKNQILDYFRDRGLEGRVFILDRNKTHIDHLSSYTEVDIALDTFPYNGTTTTCEALSCGVPVVALEGNVHLSRVSAGILNSIGCPELIATTTREYVAKAVELAGNGERCSYYHSTISDKFQNSEITDVQSMVEAFDEFVAKAVLETHEQ